MGKGIVDKLKEEFKIEDGWLPMEIHQETPSEGVPLSSRFPEAMVERMYSNLRRMGKEYNIEFKPNEVLSNSHFALAAGEYAKEAGKFNEYHEKVFHAYFTDGKDIGDIKVILNIAESIGIDRQELEKRLNEGSYDDVLKDVLEIADNNEIDSTPTFILDDKYSVVGAQSVEAFREVLIKIENGSTC